MSIKPSWRKITILFVILLSILVRSVPVIETFNDKVRVFTRSQEYDYSTWTIDALATKFEQSALDLANYLDEKEQKLLVLDYINLVRQSDQLQGQISLIFSDPNVSDPNQKAADQLSQLAQLEIIRKKLGPMAESIIQKQVSEIVANLDLAFIGQPFPPVLYHVSPLPMHLIVSPRSEIREDASISLQADMDLKTITDLENSVENNLNVSALVVPVGGISNYPTMVMSSSDLSWQIEVVGHEWIHNYLEFRPLGVNYDTSPELRTMNETTANLAGKEIARAVLEKYYPELVPPETSSSVSDSSTPPSTPQPEEFSFQKEMHKTRVKVDELLAAGKIDDAETYMESQRKVLWDHGYQIRRLTRHILRSTGHTQMFPAAQRVKIRSGQPLPDYGLYPIRYLILFTKFRG